MMAITTACQKEASTLAGRLSVLGTGYAWNLTKPDMRSRVAGGAILTIPKALSAAGHYPVLDNAVMHGFLHSATFAHRVCNAAAGFLESIKKGGISATLESVGQSAKSHFGHYETFVVDCVADGELDFKPSGASLAFLRWRRLISSCAAATMNCKSVSSLPFTFSILARTSSERRSADPSSACCSPASTRRRHESITHDEKLAPGFFIFSRSTLDSIASIRSCGKRMFFTCDLLFLFPVATYMPLSYFYVCTQYIKRCVIKSVDKNTHISLMCKHTLSTGDTQITKPGSARTLTGPLTNNDKVIIEVAMFNRTTPLTGWNSVTPNKFTWRFLALSRTDREAKPCRLSVEAYSEREARQVLAPHFILSLAARLPVQEVSHV